MTSGKLKRISDQNLLITHCSGKTSSKSRVAVEQKQGLNYFTPVAECFLDFIVTMSEMRPVKEARDEKNRRMLA